MSEVVIEYCNGNKEIFPGVVRSGLDPITGFYSIKRNNFMGDSVNVLINLNRVDSICITKHMEGEKDESV